MLRFAGCWMCLDLDRSLFDVIIFHHVDFTDQQNTKVCWTCNTCLEVDGESPGCGYKESDGIGLPCNSPYMDKAWSGLWPHRQRNITCTCKLLLLLSLYIYIYCSIHIYILFLFLNIIYIYMYIIHKYGLLFDAEKNLAQGPDLVQLATPGSASSQRQSV